MATGWISQSTTNLFFIVICGTSRFFGNHFQTCCATNNPILQRLNMTTNFTKITIAITHTPPFSIVEKHGNKTIISGYESELVVSLLNFMNIKYDIHVEESNTYGSLHNGSWTGLLSNLALQKADLLLPTMSYTPKRNKIADFSMPIFMGTVSVIYRRHNTDNDKFNIGPHVQIHTKTFLILGLLVLVSSGLLTASSILTTNDHCQKMSPNFNVHQIPDQNYFLQWTTFFYACICNATGKGNFNYVSKCTSSKIFVISYTLSMMLIITWFSSMITSRATVINVDMEVNSLRALITKNSMKVTAIRDSSVIEDMKGAKSPDILALLSENMLEDNLVANADEGIHKVMEDNFIFIVSFDGLPLDDKFRCELVIAKEFFRRRYYCLALRKNSTLLPVLDEMIRKIQESGILIRLRNKYFETSSSTNSIMCNPSSSKQVTLQHTIFSFIILLAGITVALIVCLIEIVSKDILKTLQLFYLIIIPNTPMVNHIAKRKH